jgi:hypothetical protein
MREEHYKAWVESAKVDRLASPYGLHENHKPARRGDVLGLVTGDGMTNRFRPGRECGIPHSWIDDWEEHPWVKAKTDK